MKKIVIVMLAIVVFGGILNVLFPSTEDPERLPDKTTVHTEDTTTAEETTAISEETEAEATVQISETTVPPVVETEAPTVIETTLAPITTPAPVITDPPVIITEATTPAPVVTDPPQITYVLNTNTMKFHSTYCWQADRIKEENLGSFTGNKDDLVAQGYSPCGTCNP